MSTTDTPTSHDTKAGHSSMCRRGDHRTCKTAQARCTCNCHGNDGQTPPQPKEPTVPEPARHLAPVTTPGRYQCTDCDRSFDLPQGLGRHRTAHHGATSAKKPATKTPPQTKPTAVKPPAPATPATEPPVVTDPVIVIDHQGHLIAHRIPANATNAITDLLTELGHTTWIAHPA